MAFLHGDVSWLTVITMLILVIAVPVVAIIFVIKVLTTFLGKNGRK